jgi:secondary thiamine-phosphate synthase enzyme
MRQSSETLEIATRGQGLYEFTPELERFMASSRIRDGLLTVYCRHTSCSLLIQENADPDVQADLKTFFARLVPRNMVWVTHTAEGADDMPAHIKSALTQTSISIPVSDGRAALGTWQGLYLFEHRDAPHRRQIVMHVLGEG